MSEHNPAGRILVTGGAGYIGAHTCVSLINAGYEPVILDNFVNSSPIVIDRIEAITGYRPDLIEADIRDKSRLEDAFKAYDFSAVMHFAALKAVGRSVEMPLEYYSVNIAGTVAVLEAMQATGARKFVFSSSGAVYGAPERLPVSENDRLSSTSPYGRSKIVSEGILADLVRADSSWRIVCLRYFNPFGAHQSGLIGEDPKGIPDNLGPYIAQVASGRRRELSVFGNNYPTCDGTGVRDYLHVVDVADGHVAALDYLEKNSDPLNVNLGTGTGHSVLELVSEFEKACGSPIPYRILERRTGDIAELYADPTLAAEKLGWKAQLTLADMCRDFWRWQSKNHQGYATQL